MKKKKEKASAHSVKEKEKKSSIPRENSEEEKPFDFGGLPDRDLKKNLGCG